MNKIWNDPVNENRVISKIFSIDESHEIDERLNRAIAEANRESRINEINNIRSASRTYI
jgi:hypothetical protein